MNRHVDAVIVGAGPAGTTAALELARAGLEVMLFERGERPGGKNLSGAVLYTHGLAEILPEFREQAPLERPVTRRGFGLLATDGALVMDLSAERLSRRPHGAYTVLRSRFDAWYADQAVAAGALLVPETTVESLIEENGRVVGVLTGRDDGEVRAGAVIVAEGAPAFCLRRAGFRAEPTPEEVRLGVKQILSLPRATIEERFHLNGQEEGVAIDYLASHRGVPYGGFLYTNRESLSVGVVAPLASLATSGVDSTELLDAFVAHPAIAPLVRGATPSEYGAHLLPKPAEREPELSPRPGLLVAGDAARLILNTGFTLEGMNVAIASGKAAARAVLAAAEASEAGVGAGRFYRQELERSGLLADLKRFSRAARLLDQPEMHSLYPEAICAALACACTVDGNPRPSLLAAARAAVGEQLSPWRVVRDGAAFFRGLVWRR